MPLSNEDISAYVENGGLMYGEGSYLNPQGESNTFKSGENPALDKLLMNYELNGKIMGETPTVEKKEEIGKFAFNVIEAVKDAEKLPRLNMLDLEKNDIVILSFVDEGADNQLRTVALEVMQPQQQDITRPRNTTAYLEARLVEGSSPLLTDDENQYITDFRIHGTTFGGSSIQVGAITEGLYLEVSSDFENFRTPVVAAVNVLRPSEDPSSEYTELTSEDLTRREVLPTEEIKTFSFLEDYFDTVQENFFVNVLPDKNGGDAAGRWESPVSADGYKLTYNCYGISPQYPGKFSAEIGMFIEAESKFIKVSKLPGDKPGDWIYQTQVFTGIHNAKTYPPYSGGDPEFETVYNYSNSKRYNNTTGFHVWNQQHDLKYFKYVLNADGELESGPSASYLPASDLIKRSTTEIVDDKIIVKDGDRILVEQPVDISEEVVSLFKKVTQNNINKMKRIR